jgi:hypothetical protein
MQIVMGSRPRTWGLKNENNIPHEVGREIRPIGHSIYYENKHNRELS